MTVMDAYVYNMIIFAGIKHTPEYIDTAWNKAKS